MPHDMNGNELQVGDAVMIPGTVKEIHQTDEYCNIRVDTSREMFPSQERTQIHLNAGQVIKPELPEHMLRAKLEVIRNQVAELEHAATRPQDDAQAAQARRILYESELEQAGKIHERSTAVSGEHYDDRK